MFNEIGVQPVTIPLPFRLNHVNCFIGEGSNGWTIMDAGLNNDVSRDIWKPYIEQHKISTIILTHLHPDHYGYSGTLQRLTNAEVWMTKVDDEAGTTFWEPESLEKVKKYYDTCGIPDNGAAELTHDEGSFIPRVKPYPQVSRHLNEGEKIVFGKYDYEVFFTPGHSDGLICLFNKEKSILFSTDHILPKITPNISYWFRGLPNPLEAFFQSLKKIELLDADYVIPSHGKPFQNANKRIAELISHHQDRLNEVYTFIKNPATIYQVSKNLFKKPLNTHETRFAIGETIAHLEYLYYNNQCIKNLENGIWYYQAI
ncbi:MBL fold metallo-hydrolase [Neobacillus mesonae]|uniref:MBL fold metallo-hydrolase n=1 Tax=Neobacillus mesonae TaxID=1193713 RepID=UPI00203CF9BF|nr:MBL fold metallo-hydrolase [Neobacillus mesonae]MCM3567681.1 MBL fold metallo-hydrolase [Neobacillus mesonae]